MQKFFTDTIENSFIKELVYSSNIPSYDSVSDGDYVFASENDKSKRISYIYKNHIIEVTKSGYIGVDREPKANYFEKRSYIFNERISKITENYISKFNYYDSETHYHLGRYLRLLRDCNGIDLMPFYNCYNAKTVSDVYLSKITRDKVLFIGESSKDDEIGEKAFDYKVVLVPIRFNKTYTICIDCFTEVKMKPILYGNFGLITNSPFPDNSNEYLGRTEMRFNSLSFKRPVTYECDLNKIEYSIKNDSAKSNTLLVTTDDIDKYIDISALSVYSIEKLKYNDDYLSKSDFIVNYNNKRIYINREDISVDDSILVEYIEAKKLTEYEKTKMISYEKDLYLLIQLPVNNDSSILVQEGNYTNLTKTKYDNQYGSGDSVGITRVYNEENINNLTNAELNNILLSELQLQRLNTKESYPYATRLIEYLLDNVITSKDEFYRDIERVQGALRKFNPPISSGKEGIWDRHLRSSLFREYISCKDSNIRKRVVCDINGFVDKDVEDYIRVVDTYNN